MSALNFKQYKGMVESALIDKGLPTHLTHEFLQKHFNAGTAPLEVVKIIGSDPEAKLIVASHNENKKTNKAVLIFIPIFIIVTGLAIYLSTIDAVNNAKVNPIISDSLD